MGAQVSSSQSRLFLKAAWVFHCSLASCPILKSHSYVSSNHDPIHCKSSAIEIIGRPDLRLDFQPLKRQVPFFPKVTSLLVLYYNNKDRLIYPFGVKKTWVQILGSLVVYGRY